MTHTPTPWTHDGPDEFGDYSFTGPENALAIAVVVQNLRDPEVTKDTAEFLGTAVNSHDGLLEALEGLADVVHARKCWQANWGRLPDNLPALKKARAAVEAARL